MRWWCGPYELGSGREFCSEYCTNSCAALAAGTPDTCSASPVLPLPDNAFAWEMFRDSFWQFASNGMGDATLNAVYVQTSMADRGITGPERDEQMQKLRVLVEEFSSCQSIRAKRKKKEDS